MKHIPNSKQHKRRLKAKKLFEEALEALAESDEAKRKKMIRRATLAREVAMRK